MDKQLLIQIYNVGVGDCIYLRVPEKVNGSVEFRHIVIDCGSITASEEEGEAMLVRALTHIVEEMLPKADAGGDRKKLDLLVVTHPHLDHYASFGIEKTQVLWKRVDVKELWLSSLVDETNDCAAATREKIAKGKKAVKGLLKADISAPLSAFAQELFSLNAGQISDGVAEFLTDKAFHQKDPVYIDDSKIPEAEKLFKDSKVKMHILGPTKNIDDEYIDEMQTQAFGAASAIGKELGGSADPENWWKLLSEEEQKNLPISPGDFRNLRKRMANIGVKMAMKYNDAINNCSIVLLLEWYDYRLLFTGDAECKFEYNGKYGKNHENYSWNVMAEYHPDLLLQEMDFLKVGHHGSKNASPYKADDEDNEAHKILDKIAPPNKKRLRAVVSCARHYSWPHAIPQRALMETLGERIANARVEYDEWPVYKDIQKGAWPKKESDRREFLVPKGIKQPPRTDLEHQYLKQETQVSFIELKFPPDEP